VTGGHWFAEIRCCTSAGLTSEKTLDRAFCYGYDAGRAVRISGPDIRRREMVRFKTPLPVLNFQADSVEAVTQVGKDREMQASPSMWALLKRVHNDEQGAVSLETILIIGAIVLPILIFLLKFGWPRIRDYFFQNLENLEQESDNVGGNR